MSSFFNISMPLEFSQHERHIVFSVYVFSGKCECGFLIENIHTYTRPTMKRTMVRFWSENSTFVLKSNPNAQLSVARPLRLAVNAQMLETMIAHKRSCIFAHVWLNTKSKRSRASPMFMLFPKAGNSASDDQPPTLIKAERDAAHKGKEESKRWRTAYTCVGVNKLVVPATTTVCG